METLPRPARSSTFPCSRRTPAPCWYDLQNADAINLPRLLRLDAERRGEETKDDEQSEPNRTTPQCGPPAGPTGDLVERDGSLGRLGSRVKAHPTALTPSPRGLPRPEGDWLESLGLSNCVDYPVSAIVPLAGTARPRQGIDGLDAASHNGFWRASHIESTRLEMQESAED